MNTNHNNTTNYYYHYPETYIEPTTPTKYPESHNNGVIVNNYDVQDGENIERRRVFIGTHDTSIGSNTSSISNSTQNQHHNQHHNQYQNQRKRWENRIINTFRICETYLNFRHRDIMIVLLILSSVMFIMIHHMMEIKQFSNLNTNNDRNSNNINNNGLDNFADLYTSLQQTDVPFLWQMPIPGRKSSVLEDIFVECFHANSKNSLSLGLETDLTVFTFDSTSTNESQSSSQSSSSQSPTRIITSPELQNLSTIFSSTARGRFIAIFQHPVKLTIEQYHNYVSSQTQEAHYQHQSQHQYQHQYQHQSQPIMTIEEFVSSPNYQDNIITRSIANTNPNHRPYPHPHPNPNHNHNHNHDNRNNDNNDNNDTSNLRSILSMEDVNYAKKVLRRKCLVGLNDNIEEFLFRLEHFFQGHFLKDILLLDTDANTDTDIDIVIDTNITTASTSGIDADTTITSTSMDINLDSMNNNNNNNNELEHESCSRKVIQKHQNYDNDIMNQYQNQYQSQSRNQYHQLELIIEEKNKFDIMLYEYIQELFQDEAIMNYKIQRQGHGQFHGD